MAREGGAASDMRSSASWFVSSCSRSYDFVEDRTDNGRKFRMFSVIDEFTHVPGHPSGALA